MIKEMIVELKTIDENTWGAYIFKRDPIGDRVTEKEKEDIIGKAGECGRLEAAELKDKYGDRPCREYAGCLGLTISRYKDCDSKDYILFARFNSPDKISIYMDSVNKAEEIVKRENLSGLLDGVKIEDVLTAHEMFHFIESRDKEIYTRKKKIKLWNIGPIKYTSGLVAAGEIAAMAFAMELLNLSYYPGLFDILLLWPHDENKAKMLYEEVIAMKGV
ncbi:MAG TPA: hypothetical protein DD426_00270 [Clostridiaceae bacterium]|nr:hypothetical protein [Clostridiaceae bacterium]